MHKYLGVIAVVGSLCACIGLTHAGQPDVAAPLIIEHVVTASEPSETPGARGRSEPSMLYVLDHNPRGLDASVAATLATFGFSDGSDAHLAITGFLHQLAHDQALAPALLARNMEVIASAADPGRVANALVQGTIRRGFRRLSPEDLRLVLGYLDQAYSGVGEDQCGRAIQGHDADGASVQVLRSLGSQSPTALRSYLSLVLKAFAFEMEGAPAPVTLQQGQLDAAAAALNLSLRERLGDEGLARLHEITSARDTSTPAERCWAALEGLRAVRGAKGLPGEWLVYSYLPQ